MSEFNRIAILAKPSEERIERTLLSLYQILSERQLTIMADDHASRYLEANASSLESIQKNADLAVVVGGDGTLLRAARLLTPYNVPIVGINLGRLGFLVDVSPDEMTHLLGQILDGHYLQEQRFLLNAEAYRGAEKLGSSDAANDVVLHVRNDIRMIEFTTHINGKFVSTQRADGIIVATPTGSTAYSLSGGGPILHPELEAISLVPICPHTLNNRPIVVHSNDIISLTLCESRHVEARVSFDGQGNINLQPGDKVIIKRKPETLRLLHPENYDYYHILRAKLRWNVQP
jgi:NAD+ kinase